MSVGAFNWLACLVVQKVVVWSGRVSRRKEVGAIGEGM